MAITDVITYAEALERLNMTPEDAPPARVQPLISAVTKRLEGDTGSYFVQRQYIERHLIDYLGYKSIVLHRLPIVNVISVIDDEGNTIDASDYYVEASMGRLRHKHTWPAPAGAWNVTIIGGWFANTALVDSNIKQAASIRIKDGLEVKDSSSAGQVVSETVGPVKVDFANSSQTSGGGVSTLEGEIRKLMMPYVVNVRVW